MKLNEIFEKSGSILTHAERDFYLAFCSFADFETGFTFAKIVTVAERCGIKEKSKSSASRMFKKLENLGFIRKVKGGFLCLVGYQESSQEINSSSPQVNQSSQEINSHIKELSSHLPNQLPDGREEVRGRAGIPVNHLPAENEQIDLALQTLFELDLCTPFSRHDWKTALVFALNSGFDLDKLTACVEWLRTDKQFAWRDSDVSAKMFSENFKAFIRLQQKPKPQKSDYELGQEFLRNFQPKNLPPPRLGVKA